MKVAILGDRFITNEVLQTALEKKFAGSGLDFDYVYLTDDWPIEPVQQNEEVREFVGSDEAVAALVPDVEIILTHTAPITKRVVAAAQKLQVIAAARGGPVNINWQACTARRIPVLYAPGRNSGAVAELAVGLILAATRNIVEAHISLMAERRWRGDLYVYESVGLELSRATAGLVGFGAIGSKVARILTGFGANILVYDPFVAADKIESLGYRSVGLDELLREADIVSLHARLTPETQGMIGARELGLMKRSAYLINTARGELIQHDQLYRALAQKQIAGAGLDIFEAEPPPPDSPLFKLHNVVATTHLGGASIQAAEIGAEVAVHGVFQFIRGTEIPKFCVNPEVFKL
jgi:D-3-phosphoglycerate dehydrogenase